MSYDNLRDRAREAQSNAYAPYSEFAVGAAILTADGSIYTGANIENINFSNTTHAEENALNKAVLDGYRDFEAMAIATSGDPAPPCGMCRQSLTEFCDNDFTIIVDGLGEYRLGELIPNAMNNIS